ncbi:MAG: DMT family transporter [Pseudomonadota bacterium]
MERKPQIDAFGAMVLLLFSALMGLNQVLIKLVNDGFSPVFQAGFRSACAMLPVIIYALLTRRALSVTDGSFLPGIFCGLLFSAEFLLLFSALEYTPVNRASVLFYTMPVWVAVAAHFLFPGEQLTPRRIIGLGLAVIGVGVALLDEPPQISTDYLLGDLMCIGGSLCWAGIAITARMTKFSRSVPEMQLIYQLAVSGPVLMLMAPYFGPVVRDLTGEIIGIFTFQVLAVVAFGMLTWFWVLRYYPASDMTAFSFLAPLAGVISAWLILDEQITPAILIALGLVGLGIALISWKKKPAAQPPPSDR